MKVRKKRVLPFLSKPNDSIVDKFDHYFAIFEHEPSKGKLKRLSRRRRRELHLSPFSNFSYYFVLHNPSFPENIDAMIDEVIDVVVSHGGFTVLGFDPKKVYMDYEILVTKEVRFNNEYTHDELLTLGQELGRILRTTEFEVKKFNSFWGDDVVLETIKGE